MNNFGLMKTGDVVDPLGSSDKNKQWQRELLMERLRSHSSQYKTFHEYSRAMRMSMLEKRYALDAVEKSNLQKCLDSMQHCIKVTTRQGLIERLESLSRQLGLKFMEDTAGLFISSDMFYLEIILDNDGKLRDVKVHHECKIEQQSCSELVQCLLNGDFADFTVQLEGLSSIYQLNAEPKVKSKAFVALQAMETDLFNLFQIQQFHKDMYLTLMDSIVGIVLRRRGGHSMKLIYFISPYDLLNLDTKSIAPITIDLISKKSHIGLSVSVNLEASSANRLQILPTVTFNKDNNMQGETSTIPIYSPLNSMNSTLLPAIFVLRLNKPLPICKSLLSTLTHLNYDNMYNSQQMYSIMDLIVQTASEGQIKSSLKGLNVNLPDQNHIYYFTENKALKGTIITCIPFTEPSQVPKILCVLKKQAIFYTLLASCVRPLSKLGDLETMVILEINAISIVQVSVTLEHPYEESMVTVEFDLSNGKNIVCSIYSINNNYDAIATKLSKIVQKSLSIPITIRSLLKFWEQERFKGYQRGLENGSNFNLPLGPNDPGGGRGNNSSIDYREMKIKNERGTGGNIGNRQFFHTSNLMMNTNEMQYFNSLSTNNLLYKTNNEMNGSVTSGSNQMVAAGVKGFTNEDFSKDPKSNNYYNKAEIFCNNIYENNSDSSSLGDEIRKSEVGVTGIQKSKKNDDSLENKQYNNSSKQKVKQCENLKKTVNSKSNNNLNKTVNITPMSANELTSVLTGMGLEKRPGIEIIPITSANTQNFQTSITITPINISKSDKKFAMGSKKINDDTKLKNEKKRKRKKEDTGQMGPPEKLVTKSSDTFSRNTNSSTNSSMSALKKTQLQNRSNPSCKHSSNSLSSINYLPNCNNASKTNSKNLSLCTNQKNHSPKYSVSGSSGKPSMLALKSVTNSVAGQKNEKNQKSHTKDKEKERNTKSLHVSNTGTNNNSTSPKIKSSAAKQKQTDLSSTFLQQLESAGVDNSKILADHLIAAASNEGISLNTLTSAAAAIAAGNTVANTLIQSKIRKGSLSAVIDKLKLAHNSGEEIFNDFSQKGEMGTELSNANYKIPSNSVVFNSEYMIKPSLDGMKITINKTKTKESNPSVQKITSPPLNSSLKLPTSSGSSNISPKKHTGLKPGVSSGPASKKNISTSLFKQTSSSTIGGGSSQTKTNFQKSSSSSNTTNKIGSTDLHRREKTVKNKNLIGTGEIKQTGNRPPDPMDVIKILRLSSPNNSMDGFMKTLNTKFQIPKLSARSSDDSKKDLSLNSQSTVTVSSTNLTSTISSVSNITNPETIKFPKDNSLKVQHSPTTKITPSSSEVVVNQQIQNALGKVSHLLQSNNSFKEFSQQKSLSKSSSSDGITSAIQKEYSIKSYSSSTPSTPIRVASPFTSPINAIMNSSSSVGYKSPSNSPTLLTNTVSSYNHSNNLTMRPPSAPCTVDVTKVVSVTDQQHLASITPAFNSVCNNPMSKKLVSPASAKKNMAVHTLQQKLPPSSLSSSTSLSLTSASACIKGTSSQQPSSVSIHIVKSPVPSPLMLLPSPHSNSSCITDEEIIDESLGIKGK